jgi:hypothetical protein
MEIYPQNLGQRYHTEIVRRRAAKGLVDPRNLLDAPIPAPKLGIWGKFWARGSNLTEAQAAVGAPATSIGIQHATGLTLFMGSVLGITGLIVGQTTHDPTLGWLMGSLSIGTFTALGFGPFAKMIFQKAHRAMTVLEIEEMINKCQDELRKTYLGLVRDAMLVPVPNPPSENVRLAIEALGEAIEGLPAVISAPIDTDALRQEAIELRQKATTESDTITAESLVRQADSLEQRIETSERSAIIAKRSSVLRDEIFAKIAALREAIAAQQTGLVDVTTLTELSESARHVAREAQSTASAKDELARYLTPQNEQVEQNVQKLGR